MNTPETLDALEAPPANLDPVTRLDIALQARLAHCPQCGTMQMRLETRHFENAEGKGRTVRAAFACESAITAMITPAARIRIYAFEPCRVAMRQSAMTIASQASVAAGEVA